MIKNLIQLITEGDAAAIDAAFNTLLMSKVNTTLDIKRVELASNLYTTEEVVNESVLADVSLIFSGKCDTDELLLDKENEFITVEDVKKVGNFIVVVPMHLKSTMSSKEMAAINQYAKWAKDKYKITYEGTNVAIASVILNTISREVRPDSKDDIEIDGKYLYLGLRKYDYFRARGGEEDDDHPRFVGYPKVNDIAKKALSKYADLYKIDVGEDEKAWFTVSLKLNESVINEGHDVPWLDVVYDELGKENADAIEKACKKLRVSLSTRDYNGLHNHLYIFDAHKGFVTKELNDLLKDNKGDSDVIDQLKIIAKASKIKLTEDIDESVANPNNFELLVKAIGYETTTIVVQAATQSEATKNYKREAFKKFAKHNDISMGDSIGFGSLSVSKTKKDVTESYRDDSSIMQWDDQQIFHNLLKKRFKLKAMVVYFDDDDMVSSKDDKTIFPHALDGKHTFGELINFVKKKFSLKESVIDEAIEDHSIVELVMDKSTAKGKELYAAFDKLRSLLYDNDHKIDKQDYKKVFEMFYDGGADWPAAKKLLIKLVSDYATDNTICGALNAIAAAAGIKGV